MSEIFISHVEEDEAIALEIAAALEAAGYTTWYYERDSMPGLSYLLQTKQAVEASRAVVVIVSPASLQSPQMTKEVVRAHEADRPFIPVLRDVTHAGFQQRQPEWWEAMGAAASVRIPAEGVGAILPRILGGLRGLGIISQAEQARAVHDLVTRADQAATAGDWEQAAADLERAKELAPGDHQIAAKLATVRAGQRSQQMDRLSQQAEQAGAKGDWSRAEAALVEALALSPDDAQLQARLAEARQRQHTAELVNLRSRAEGLARAEKWDEALSTWREYLAQEPEDSEAASTAVREVERGQAMARAYAEAEAALGRKDYDRAIELLRELIVQDVNYRQASLLLGRAVEQRRTGSRRGLARWQMAIIAGAALILLALGLSQLLPALKSPQPQPTAPASAVAPTVTRSGNAIAVSPAAVSSERSAETAASATPATQQPEPSPSARGATPGQPTAAITVAAPRQTKAPPTALPTPVGTPGVEFYSVPGDVVNRFFAPGPSPSHFAVTDDAIWVFDSQQATLYKLDRTGALLTSVPITSTDYISGMEWDGEAVRLLVSATPEALVIRVDPGGKTSPPVSQSLAPVNQRKTQLGSRWDYSWGFLIEYDQDGMLLQTRPATIFGTVQLIRQSRHGVWIINSFCDYDIFALTGTHMSSGDLPEVGPFCDDLKLDFDEAGYLWMLNTGGKLILQVALSQISIPPPTPGPSPTRQPGVEQVLPRPAIQRADMKDKAVVRVINELSGTVTLSFGDESAILSAGGEWSMEMDEGSYAVFASSNVPEPVAFSDQVLVLAGYEFTWTLR